MQPLGRQAGWTPPPPWLAGRQAACRRRLGKNVGLSFVDCMQMQINKWAKTSF
jgi:hypothetical protein